MANVVVTGMGVLSTAGKTPTEFWNCLFNGTITYREIKEYVNNKNYRYHVGAKIEDYSWYDCLNTKWTSFYGKASQYVLYTASEALKDAEISKGTIKENRIGVVIGSTMGEIDVEEKISRTCYQKEPVNTKLLRQYQSDNISMCIRELLPVSGPVFMVPAACASGNYAVALGKLLIDSDRADVVIAGGVDVFSKVAFTGFQRLLSLSPDVCKPFDKNRKGLILGEGCGIVILENKSHAKARGKNYWGEVLSCGLSSDGYHMTAPHPEGIGTINSIKSALNQADITPDKVDYISAHGTGTPANDKYEAMAIRKIFKDYQLPPISSIKSMLGHSLGAASALEMIASLLMMINNWILPTVNVTEEDPECGIDCVPMIGRKAKLQYVLSNSAAFGGQISSLLLKRGNKV